MTKVASHRRVARRDAVTASPRVYGATERFKGILARQIAGGEALLDELEGVRKRAAPAAKTKKETPERTAMTLIGYYRLRQWNERVDRWRRNVISAADRQLADQVERLLPRVSAGLDTRAAGRLQQDESPPVETWLRRALDELKALQASLGVRRNVAPAAPGRFDELRASGLVDPTVIDSWAKDILHPRTPKQLADAIGAAKEISEGTLRSALDRLQVPWSDRDGLQQLMRAWRDAARPRALDSAGAQQLDHALAALGNLLAFLEGWRNAYGRGHGRPKYAAGLRAHHARLAVDVAETVARFVVLTMDEMARLPPKH